MITKVSTIKVLDLDGNSIDLLSKYSTRNKLLLFYNNDCLGCTGRAIPLAYEIQKEHPDLSVIGIHSNFSRIVTKKDIESIFTSGFSPFPIYIDEHHKIYDHFKCEGTPHWVILDKENNIYRSFFGSQGNSQNRMSYALEELLNQ